MSKSSLNKKRISNIPKFGSLGPAYFPITKVSYMSLKRVSKNRCDKFESTYLDLRKASGLLLLRYMLAPVSRDSEIISIPINEYLGKSIYYRLLLVSCSQTCLKEWQQELETISGFNFLDKFVEGNGSMVDAVQKVLNDLLITIDI